MSKCSICDTTVTNKLLKKKWCDPNFPTIPLGPWCPDCLPKVVVCHYCRKQTVRKEVNDHGYPLESELNSDKRYCCNECESKLKKCLCCNELGLLSKAPDGKKYCKSCMAKRFKECGCCGTLKAVGSIVTDKLTKAQWKGVFKRYGAEVCNECFQSVKGRFKKYDVKICHKCSGVHTESGNYCTICKEHLIVCTHCGQAHHESYHLEVDRNRVGVCPTCHKKARACKSCGTSTFEKTQGKVFSKVIFCKVCSKGEECSICRRRSDNLEGGICRDCNHWYTNNKCPDCGRIRDTSHDCRVCDGKGTYNYSTKPPIYFHGEGTIFFGIENEVTFGSSSSKANSFQKELYKAYGPDFMLCKSDGSISGYGYEIVTQPMSLGFFNKVDLTKLFSPNMQKCSSVGMHVHVSRNSFSNELHLMKVMQLIYDNPKEVDKIVGRSYTGYNKKLNGKSSKAVLDMKKGGNRGNRTARVNLTNQNTVEFRMFAGCIEEVEMRRRIEFLHAVISFTREASVGLARDFNELVSFIQNNRKSYPNASKWYSV